MNNRTYKLTVIALMTALSILLAYIIRFPIFPSAAFLEYDPADVTIMIITFMYGPFTGLFMTLIVCLIQGVTVSASSGFIGILMHFISTGTMVLVSGFIYKKFHNLKGAIFALLMGIAAWTLIMIPCNLIFTPLFGVPIQAVKDMMFTVLVPFNLIKGTLNALVTFILYKNLHKLIMIIERKTTKTKSNEYIYSEQDTYASTLNNIDINLEKNVNSTENDFNESNLNSFYENKTKYEKENNDIVNNKQSDLD